MIKFQLTDLKYAEMLGLIPEFLSPTDKRPAREQLDSHYKHGGGWQPLAGWKLLNCETGKIHYPNDPPLLPIAKTKLPLTDEIIFVYPHAWVLILQADGNYEVARMD